MRKTLLVLVAAFALALGGSGAGDAMAYRGGGHYGGGHVSGGHFGGGHYGGGHYRGGGHYGGYYGGHHGGHYGHGHGGVSFVFGVGPWYYPYPYYPYYGYYPYGYSYSTPVVIESQPPAVRYLYYCSDPSGYYPDVRRCPTGWTRMAPEEY